MKYRPVIGVLAASMLAFASVSSFALQGKGGGGCIYNPDGPADATLPLILLAALVWLGARDANA